MAAKKHTSIARVGFADEVAAARNYGAFKILPSHIRSNHANNYARASIYTLAVELPELAGHPALESEQICFTRAEVLARAESFRANNQRTAIKVWRTSTHVPYVGEGYLRHLAALYLEVTGGLAEIADMKTGLRCEAEEQPRSPEEQIAAAWSNHAENADRKDTSPIDDAWLCKRLLTMQVSRDDIAARLHVSKRTVDRLLSLLALPIDTQLAVHEGRATVIKALSDASAKGQGNARGSNGGVARKAMRRRNRDDRPTERLTPAQIDALVDIVSGDVLEVDVEDANVLAWARYLNAPPAPREPKTTRKKAGPKPGEKASAS
jgi:hypothetical protein